MYIASRRSAMRSVARFSSTHARPSRPISSRFAGFPNSGSSPSTTAAAFCPTATPPAVDDFTPGINERRGHDRCTASQGLELDESEVFLTCRQHEHIRRLIEGELETATDVSNEMHPVLETCRIDLGSQALDIGIVPTSGHDDLNRSPGFTESASCLDQMLDAFLDMDPTQKQQNRSLIEKRILRACLVGPGKVGIGAPDRSDWGRLAPDPEETICQTGLARHRRCSAHRRAFKQATTGQLEIEPFLEPALLHAPVVEHPP